MSGMHDNDSALNILKRVFDEHPLTIVAEAIVEVEKMQARIGEMESALDYPVEQLSGIITGGDVRKGIMALQEKMLELPQADFPLIHHWADKEYGREIFIRKGSLIVGKIHKHSHVNVISMGDVTVVTEFGIERMKAPKTFVSAPGTKRALFAHEDTIWTTIHVTDKTTEADAEDELIAKDYAEYDELAFQRNLSLATGSAMPTINQGGEQEHHG